MGADKGETMTREQSGEMWEADYHAEYDRWLAVDAEAWDVADRHALAFANARETARMPALTDAPTCCCGNDHDCRSSGCNDECPTCSGAPTDAEPSGAMIGAPAPYSADGARS